MAANAAGLTVDLDFDLLEELDPDSPIPQSEYDSLMDDLWAIAEAEMDTWAKDGAFPYDKELLRLHLRTGNMKKMKKAAGKKVAGKKPANQGSAGKPNTMKPLTAFTSTSQITPIPPRQH